MAAEIGGAEQEGFAGEPHGLYCLTTTENTIAYRDHAARYHRERHVVGHLMERPFRSAESRTRASDHPARCIAELLPWTGTMQFEQNLVEDVRSRSAKKGEQQYADYRQASWQYRQPDGRFRSGSSLSNDSARADPGNGGADRRLQGGNELH